MTQYIFANRAYSTLTRAAAISDTTLRINVAEAARFPVPTVATPAQLVIVSATGIHEIVSCTGRVGEDLTVVRGQEGTPAVTFPIGSRVEHRLTAAALRNFLQLGGGALTGNIDMNNNMIDNVTLGFTRAEKGMNIGLLAALDNNQSRALALPNGGGHPQIGQYMILTMEFMWRLVFACWLNPEHVPWYLKLCDGTLDTPDLRNRFILGTPQAVGGSGAAGGSFNGLTNVGGAHNHQGATQLTYLQNGNLPNINQAGYGEVFVEPKGGLAGAVKAIRSPLNFPVPGSEYAGAVPHQHPMYDDPGHNHDFIFVPPYMTMCYVMFRHTP